MSQTGNITELLDAWRRGSDEAGDALAEQIYPELRRRAASLLRRGWPAVSLQVTELVHETYLRLLEQRQVEWANRSHFFAIASCFIRRVLMNAARASGAEKRGAGYETVPLDETAEPEDVDREDLLALDRELDRLREVDPIAVRVVELRYFVGLSINDTASVMNVGRTTVVRKWRAARAWLRVALDPVRV